MRNRRIAVVTGEASPMATKQAGKPIGVAVQHATKALRAELVAALNELTVLRAENADLRRRLAAEGDR